MKAGRALGLRIIDDNDLDAPPPAGVLVLRWDDLEAPRKHWTTARKWAISTTATTDLQRGLH